MKYDIHPSQELVDLFKEKPYQGSDPSAAKVIVIGNDANYSPEISNHQFFRNILDYHADGVNFWKAHNVHHPFLLRDYPFDKRKGGVRYHQNFGKMGFDSDFANFFSFIELLNVPTIGNTGTDRSLFFQLISKNHLEWIEDIIFHGDRKFVLVNQTLTKSIGNLSRTHGALIKLSNILANAKPASGAYESDSVTIYNGYSFSHSITNNYLNNLANLITNFISK